MTAGQELYEVWQGAMSDQGIEVDPWDMLPREDQEAWEIVANHKLEAAS